MQELVQALSQFVVALGTLLAAAGKPLLPWIPLALWVAFWLFAVDWVKLRTIWARGGWLAIVLLGAVAVVVWGTVRPTPGGTLDIFGLQVSNFVEKTIYVSGLAIIANLAGAVQLSGCCGSCCRLDEPEEDDHSNHDHDSHGAEVHAHLHAAAAHH